MTESLVSLLNTHGPLALLFALAGAAAVMLWRFRESRSPVTAPRIVLPPLGMATGFAMFGAPAARVPWSWGLTAFLAGALVLSIPLARASKLRRVDGAVVLQRSRAFLWILLGLVAVRLALRGWIEHHVSPIQTGALMYLLAFGMVVRWRAAMYRDYVRLRAAPAAG